MEFFNGHTEFSVKELAEQIGHKSIKTQPAIFKFLRMTGVLNGMVPNPILVKRGLVWVETRDVSYGRRTKSFQKVLFSEAGKNWVEALIYHYYGGSPQIEYYPENGEYHYEE